MSEAILSRKVRSLSSALVVVPEPKLKSDLSLFMGLVILMILFAFSNSSFLSSILFYSESLVFLSSSTSFAS